MPHRVSSEFLTTLLHFYNLCRCNFTHPLDRSRSRLYKWFTEVVTVTGLGSCCFSCFSSGSTEWIVCTNMASCFNGTPTAFAKNAQICVTSLPNTVSPSWRLLKIGQEIIFAFQTILFIARLVLWVLLEL